MSRARCPDCGRRRGLRVMTTEQMRRWLEMPAWSPRHRDMQFIRCPCTSVFKHFPKEVPRRTLLFGRANDPSAFPVVDWVPRETGGLTAAGPMP